MDFVRQTPGEIYALFGLGVVGEWKVEGVSKWKCEES